MLRCFGVFFHGLLVGGVFVLISVLMVFFPSRHLLPELCLLRDVMDLIC